MRYRSFLVILLLAAPATWLLAEPSKEVIVQTPLSQRAEVALETEETASPQEGWTYDISGPAVWEPPTIRIPVQPVPRPKPAYTRADMALNVAIIPGFDFDSTQFDVRVTAPEGNRDIQHVFKVSLGDDPAQVYVTDRIRQIEPSRFRFSGAQLRPWKRQSSPTAQRPQNLGSFSCVVSTSIRDSRQSRFSRGSSWVTVRSEPVHLSLL